MKLMNADKKIEKQHPV